MRPPLPSHALHRQSGAALVVALILLVAITLLALASMNTASLDLIMAGNEQYRSRAFNAAEAGLEQAAHQYTTFTTSGSLSSAGSTATNDTYSYTVTPEDGLYDAADGNSQGTYKSKYFKIVSTGASAVRNANATHTEEIRMSVYDPQTYSSCDTCDDTLE